jgi:SAM-dependent methyltransferase
VAGQLPPLPSRVLAQLEGGDHWEDVGRLQFEFLLREGLRPEHYVLDVACGSFRSGRFLIDYLAPGHYFAFDRDRQHLNAGMKHVLKPSGLLKKRPQVRVLELTDGPTGLADVLDYAAFDYVWAHALFDHIPPAMIRRCLREFAAVLAPGGRCYATIFLNRQGAGFLGPLVWPRNGSYERAVVTYPDREYWHHTLNFFEEAVADIHDFELEACLTDYPHPLGLSMLRFTRTAVGAGARAVRGA